jgi:hypothetical protein
MKAASAPFPSSSDTQKQLVFLRTLKLLQLSELRLCNFRILSDQSEAYLIVGRGTSSTPNGQVSIHGPRCA